jgi:hypothetical protein
MTMRRWLVKDGLNATSYATQREANDTQRTADRSASSAFDVMPTGGGAPSCGTQREANDTSSW